MKNLDYIPRPHEKYCTMHATIIDLGHINKLHAPYCIILVHAA